MGHPRQLQAQALRHLVVKRQAHAEPERGALSRGVVFACPGAPMLRAEARSARGAAARHPAGDADQLVPRARQALATAAGRRQGAWALDQGGSTRGKTGPGARKVQAPARSSLREANEPARVVPARALELRAAGRVCARWQPASSARRGCRKATPGGVTRTAGSLSGRRGRRALQRLHLLLRAGRALRVRAGGEPDVAL